VYRRRIVLLLVLSLACAAGGGWVLVAPALLVKGAVVAAPTAALDGRPVAAAVVADPAGARPLNDAAMQAGAPASTGAASGAVRASARCGQDQAPVFADTGSDEDGAVRGSPVQARPAGVGYLGAQRRVDAALRSTGDPFDTAVADTLNVGDLRTPGDRLAALVQDAITGDDPRLYALAFSTCHLGQVQSPPIVQGTPPEAVEAGLRACARLDPHRWAARDPGNAAPWLYALEHADAADDRAGQREALQQLGATSRFDMGFGAAAAAVARVHAPDDADLAGQTDLAMQAVTFELWPSFIGVTQRCKDKAAGDAAMVTTCEHVADVLYAHSDGIMPRVVGASIHKLATGDATLLDRARAEHQDLAEKWGAQVQAGVDAPACDHARSLLHHFVLAGKVGVVEAMKQEIAARAVPY